MKAAAVDYTDSRKYSEKSGLYFKNLIWHSRRSHKISGSDYKCILSKLGTITWLSSERSLAWETLRGYSKMEKYFSTKFKKNGKNPKCLKGKYHYHVDRIGTKKNPTIAIFSLHFLLCSWKTLPKHFFCWQSTMI